MEGRQQPRMVCLGYLLLYIGAMGGSTLGELLTCACSDLAFFPFLFPFFLPVFSSWFFSRFFLCIFSSRQAVAGNLAAAREQRLRPMAGFRGDRHCGERRLQLRSGTENTAVPARSKESNPQEKVSLKNGKKKKYEALSLVSA